MTTIDIFPDRVAFAKTHVQKQHQAVWAKMVVDLDTPVSMFLKLTKPGAPAFLLESVHRGEIKGRYSVIALEPDLIWRCFGNRAEISPAGIDAEEYFETDKQPAIASLKALVRSCYFDLPKELPPMACGLIGYMGYDMVKLMEKLPDTGNDSLGLPDACFMRPQITVVSDAVEGVVYITTPAWVSQTQQDADIAYDEACQRILNVVDRINTPLEHSQRFHEAETEPLDFRSNLTPQQYEAIVTRAKEYIVAGDIFQVVPSQRFSAPFTLPPFSLYRSIRNLNPSPFMFCLHYGGFSLVGSSPEILVRLRDGKVTVRPIAGTRKRGKTREEDKALADDLLSDPKELAEHLMLLDLGRNDVGRIAKPDSVHVTEQMMIEYYSHVMHIVSNVEGDIRDDCDAIDALIAGFPAGTVSGAPKIRAMEIIDELENDKRAFYAGCVGYFSSDGSMDTCITLRTGLIKDNTLHIQAGGGVVFDSDPQEEYQESCNKARALMRAAERATKFA